MSFLFVLIARARLKPGQKWNIWGSGGRLVVENAGKGLNDSLEE